MIATPRNVVYFQGPFYDVNQPDVAFPGEVLSDLFGQSVSAFIMGFCHIKTPNFGDYPGVQVVINNRAVQDPMVKTALTDIQNANTNGTPILVSVGGAGNASDWSNIVAKPAYWAQQIYNDLIKPYGFAGVDLDCEDWVTDDASMASAMATFIETLKGLDSSLYITLAPLPPDFVYDGQNQTDPEGHNDCYKALFQNSSVSIDWMNVQTYFGCVDPATCFSNTTQTLGVWLPNAKACDINALVALGMMPTQCPGNEQFPGLTSTIENLVKNQPGFGGITLWNYPDIASSDYSTWVSDVASALQPQTVA